MSQPTRRIVTGHLQDGRSVVLSDGPVPHIRTLPGARFDEVWALESSPPVLEPAPAGEPTSGRPQIAVGSGSGQLVRIIEFAPGGAQRVEWTTESVYLTGWAEVLCEGEWLRQIPRRV